MRKVACNALFHSKRAGLLGYLKSFQSRAENKFLAPLFALLLVEEMLQSSEHNFLLLSKVNPVLLTENYTGWDVFKKDLLDSRLKTSSIHLLCKVKDQSRVDKT